MVVNLAVLHRQDLAILTEMRLPTSIWIDDCQPAHRHAEPAAAREIEAVAVRTAANHRLVQRGKRFAIYG